MNHLNIEQTTDDTSTLITKCSPEFTPEISDQELDNIYTTINSITEDQFNLSDIGTQFDNLVWSEIRNIPFGSTRTYKDIAIQINKPMSFRAVANACGRNKLALIVPCHRVVGSNDLGGFKWGIDLKKRLLSYEKVLI